MLFKTTIPGVSEGKERKKQKKMKKGVDIMDGGWYYIQVAEIRRRNLEN